MTRGYRYALCWLVALWVAVSGCRDKRESRPMSDHFPSWIPLLAEPLPGHGGRPSMADSPYRRLTVDELKAVAYAYHPRITLAEMEVMPIEDFDGRYWRSPERLALDQVLRTGYAQLDKWQDLVRTVGRQVPEGYLVTEHTSPFNDPSYYLVVHAPVPEGTKERKVLLVFVSYLVPYYFYFEVHSRRVPVESRPDLMAEESPKMTDLTREFGGYIVRDPWVYEVTPTFADVLETIEYEIDLRYGYYRMIPDVALTDVPGIYINGYDDHLDGIPPVLKDALFSPHGW